MVFLQETILREVAAMDLQMAGQVAVVTGSSHGIGSGIAKVLAREGVSVVVNYARDREGAESVRAAIEAEGGKASVFRADVGDPAAAAALVAHALDRFGRLDILVNNAGLMGRTSFLETTQEEFDRIINTNLKGPWNCSQAAARHMVQARYGRILHCSSLAATLPSAGHAAYAASKSGIHGLTKVMAGELAPYNILVNAYLPGTFETPMSAPAMKVRGEEILSQIPLRRLGKPEEMGHLVAFLVSPLNSYMSGTVVDVIGGKLIIQNPMKPWKDAGLL